MKFKNRFNSKGFTIVELLIATTVFSVVLLLISYGLIRIGGAFTKSVNSAKTQEVARTIIDDISQAIQFNGENVTQSIGSNGESQGFCVGNRRYSYVPDRMLNFGPDYDSAEHTRASFVVDSEACNGSSTAQDLLGGPGALDSESIELMGERMSIDRFRIYPAVSGEPGFWTIEVRVAYGLNSDMEDADTDGRRQCKIGEGSKFCSVTELSTTVQKRLK